MDNRSTMEHLELATILDTMADGLFVIDPDHRISRWNRAMERLTGYSSQDAVGKLCSLIHCEQGDVQGRVLGMLDCTKPGRTHIEGEEILIRHKDGRHIPLLLAARLMVDARGETSGTVVTFTDISQHKQLEQENRQLKEQVRERTKLHKLIGQSPAMQEIFRLIELAASSDETILVTGETGTGKELAARAIHHHSARKEGPLITVNCSALSESLLESELFGHVKGAFTGAVRDHTGRFERAEGGTVFLDEIGELSPLVQVKLLRVLQEHGVERVGEAVPRRVDTRVVAATHRDLKALVQQGSFRQDLYYRLNVFPIALPPLREHRDDIPLLLTHFIERYNQKTGKALTTLDHHAIHLVMDYDWPGNIRELENAIAHAFVTCPQGMITPEDLPREIRFSQSDPASAVPPRQVKAPQQRRHLNRPALESVLQDCGWNKAEAARKLNIDRTTLWRQMKKHGIPLQPPHNES